MDSHQKKLSPSELFTGFCRIGLSGFGGVLPWARRTIVEKEKWLSPEEFSAMLGICQIAPGPNIMNLAVCVGSKFAGVRGAVAAVTGLMFTPIIIVVLLGMLYENFSFMPAVQGLLRGISAVGVGLIASTGLKMLRTEFQYPPMLMAVALTMIIAIYFHLALGWVVLITAPFALLIAWRKTKHD